jgi:hypothetical protein
MRKSFGEIGVFLAAFVSSASVVWAIHGRLTRVNRALKQELLEQGGVERAYLERTRARPAGGDAASFTGMPTSSPTPPVRGPHALTKAAWEQVILDVMQRHNFTRNEALKSLADFGY